MRDQRLELDYKPRLPPKMDYGIGVVGCGGIMNDASLPAYTAHKLNVVGCYDLDRKTAESTARKFDIPMVYDNLGDLLLDPGVQIVEFAVHPGQQFDLACRAIAAGKHLLCQKPLLRQLRAGGRDRASGARSGGQVGAKPADALGPCHPRCT